MKAISNFKALLPSRSRLNSPRLNLSPEDATTPTHPTHPPISRFRHKPKPSMDEQEMAALIAQNEEHAARLLEERNRVLQHRSNSHGGLYIVAPRGAHKQQDSVAQDSNDNDAVDDDAKSPAPTAPLILGIGTGGHNEFKPSGSPVDEPSSSIVADSPTVVDFNVYDRAYEQELQRIKRMGARPNVYMTRHVNSTERFKAQGGMNVFEHEHDRQHQEADGGIAESAKNNNNIFRANRFADLVAQTIKDNKTRMYGGGGGGDEAEDQQAQGAEEDQEQQHHHHQAN